jgi:CPA2 family monovalent cation:H+ antiporter-2
MPEGHHYLEDVLVLLLALLALVPLFIRLKLGPVLAYLTIGVVVGPSGLALITSDASMRALAELGVVFLLFSIGLEISIGRLRLFGVRTYGIALLQVPVTVLLITAVGRELGLALPGALLVGGALSFSSTAIVLQLLAERGQMHGPVGRTAIACTLMQDLAVAPMIVMVTAYGAGGDSMGTALGLALVKFIVFLLVVIAGERLALRPLLRVAAQAEAPEVFTAAVLLLVLGIGWLSEQVGLSMALGAFVAGLIVADTEFRHQVSADIQPVRGLLLGLFFVSVGISLDLGYAIRNVETIALAVLLFMAIKAAAVFAIAIAWRLPTLRALGLATLLAQGSEFAFVLLPLGAVHGLITPEQAQILTVAVGLSMMVMPVGALVSDIVIRRLPSRSALGDLERDLGGMQGHVVIAGFGQVGMAVARFLAGEQVPLLVLDLSPSRVTASRARGLPVFYGNAARRDVLRAARLDHAQVLVIVVPDPATAEQITAIARQGFRHLRIFVRAPDEGWAPKLRAAGADAVVLDSLTTALDLAERVMIVHVPEDSAGKE